MRLNRHGQIARNYERRAVAHWLDDATELYQQPVVLSEPQGKWRMVTRRDGVVTPFIAGGANYWAAGGGAWMRRLDGDASELFGSANWLPANGRVGDIDATGVMVALSDDALEMYVGDSDGPPRIFRRTEVQGETRFVDGLIAWTASGQVRVYDTRADRAVPVVQVGPGAAKALAWRDGAVVWVAYQTDAHGGVVHRSDDASQGYRYGVPLQIYAPEVQRAGAGCRLYWSEDEGEFVQPPPLVVPVLGSGMEPLALVPPIPPRPPVVPPPLPPLEISVTDYTRAGVVPCEVSADYVISGGPSTSVVRAALQLNGRTVDESAQRAGRLSAIMREADTYALVVTAIVANEFARTYVPRTVTLVTPEIPGIVYPSGTVSGTVEGARKPSQDAADRAAKENQ